MVGISCYYDVLIPSPHTELLMFSESWQATPPLPNRASACSQQIQCFGTASGPLPPCTLIIWGVAIQPQSYSSSSSGESQLVGFALQPTWIRGFQLTFPSCGIPYLPPTRPGHKLPTAYLRPSCSQARSVLLSELWSDPCWPCLLRHHLATQENMPPLL